MKLLLVAALVGFAAASIDHVDPTLLSKLEAKQSVNIVISFVGGNEKVINSIETQTFQTRGERLTALKRSLEAHAQTSQKRVQELLKEQGIKFRSYWISNQIFIKEQATKKIVLALADLPEVADIQEEVIVTKLNPIKKGPVSVKEPTPMNEWGLVMIKAPEAWETTNGTGVVVANIDGGVHRTHEALRDRYREDRGWFDPYYGSSTPADEADGHGTHTMGSITGSHGIGVAPGANWIACKGCGLISCTQDALTQCGQFMVCPTQPDGTDEDCSKAPNLVSNSWGGGRGNPWYEPITEAWIAGGIVPLFSQGNSGPSCGTSNSPGDLRRVIGVGATTSDDEIAYFSSVGPAADGRIKPEISAPGQDIRSALPDTDSAYGTMSGTSMSCPHAAGVTALVLSINSNLTFGQVRKILIEAVDTDVNTSGATCGGISDTSFPNHHFGYGRSNALKAVQAARATLAK